ncbi:Rhamnogalacturonan acetylesterase [Eremomyces bilateralis CBS 781.70]|uniref:Rhamnogalacturonan acetylesterase n=1 Tax=Eremomyces bilateralis CBS 781.70 TaxID=1392243 RepID=A0A6G1FU55_9PEZI|nr:Rhamnogalacturonan acetylesterase [Eremomyces bilateralis CBS 781.70]KAF1809191.1 Rhamnogalacturonan acetylesterase [Eremomyces bilateralis CBS 781.70]
MRSLTFVVAVIWLLQHAAAVTIYLAGDSTMAKDSNPPKKQGWGEYLKNYVSVPVVNKAIGGRSARSYTVEGRFDEIAKVVKPGDIVVIEFGHNDGGSLKNDNGRSGCPGEGNEVCQSTFNGKKVTVRTFPYYISTAGKKFTSLGATVIISSQTPNNPWETNKFSAGPPRFVELAKKAAAQVPGAEYIDHFAYAAQSYKAAGASATKAMFPVDHTHTNAKGAEFVAKTFVKAVLCGEGKLKPLVSIKSVDVAGQCI